MRERVRSGESRRRRVIPRLEVVALERLAVRDGETVNAVLTRELLDLVSVHAAWLSVEVPGFAAALAWPV